MTPRRWDLIMHILAIQLRFEKNPPKYVGRLVGLPGERVTIKQAGVWIDGVQAKLPESLEGLGYATSEQQRRLLDRRGVDEDFLKADPNGEQSWKLGPDEVLVLDDFTTMSNDSRHWGPVKTKHIEGVVTLICWPPERWRVLR
jgi:signal peptidase I